MGIIIALIPKLIMIPLWIWLDRQKIDPLYQMGNVTLVIFPVVMLSFFIMATM